MTTRKMNIKIEKTVEEVAPKKEIRGVREIKIKFLEDAKKDLVKKKATK
jgi:hypothetical protein